MCASARTQLSRQGLHMGLSGGGASIRGPSLHDSASGRRQWHRDLSSNGQGASLRDLELPSGARRRCGARLIGAAQAISLRRRPAGRVRRGASAVRPSSASGSLSGATPSRTPSTLETRKHARTFMTCSSSGNAPCYALPRDSSLRTSSSGNLGSTPPSSVPGPGCPDTNSLQAESLASIRRYRVDGECDVFVRG